tara:strand:+ start:6870 stop:8030 length:1161 start_codon:yes stop_codon:yes gene_type:complete
MPYNPKTINKGSTEISASGWNSFVRMHDDYYKSGGSFIESSSILRNSAIVDVVLDDEAEDIKPYHPCRIVKSGKFLQETGRMWYIVEPVDRVDDAGNPTERHGNYAFTLAEGVTGKGGRAVVSGLAIVAVTRDQARDMFESESGGVFNEGKYDSSYYIVPDKTLSSQDKKVIGPVGHFRFVSWYDSGEVQKQFDLLSDDLLMVVDLNQRPTSFLAKVDTTIDASSTASEVVTLNSGKAYAYYGVSESTADSGKLEVKKDEYNYEIEVFNSTASVIATGKHLVGYSMEYNRLVVLAAVASTFQVVMEENGGTQGTASSPASWLYDISLWEGDGTIIKAQADIVELPNHYKRPSVGQLEKATFGTATYNSDDELVIIDTNETLIFTTC